MRVYIAGGWFTPAQEECVTEMENACASADMIFYSPRLHGVWRPGMDSSLIVRENVKHIIAATYVLASTEGKDMGTLWECGYAWSNLVPTIYYFKSAGKFNIMLAETSFAVIENFEDLCDYMLSPYKKPYLGDKE